MYDLYKPLRNHLRQLSLLPSLLTIYRYIQFLQFGEELPPALHYPMFRFVPPVRVNLFPWTLELLARELILNAQPVGDRALDSWNGYANAWNLIRYIENEVWGRLPNGADLIHYEMLRIAQRQFPWQLSPNRRLVATYFKLYSNPRLADLLQEVFGMSALQLYQVGLSLSGHFMTEPTIGTPIANKVNTVNEAAVARFVARFSRPMGELRELMRAGQAHNVNWAYAFDPLRAFPMIQISADRLFCPMPTLLLWRITEGLYFDLVGLEAPFAAAFGPAFQDLVGEVVSAADTEGRFEVLPEVRYGTKAKPKDSVDQIVLDDTGVLFVECKASRFKVQAKIDLLDLTAIHGELDRMAGFIAQVYGTLADALDGAYPHWKPDARPIYPMVLTLDEWLPSGQLLNDDFRATVRDKVQARGVSLDLLGMYPFTLCSLQEFETAIQVMAAEGIAPVMAGKVAGEKRAYAMAPYLHGAFPTQLNDLKALFDDSWDRLTEGLG